MTSNEKAGLQRLRVPSGWTIEINNFYDVDPTEEHIEYFHSSVLISGDSRLMGLGFDSRYEPEGEPNGEFVLVMQENDYDKKGKITGATVLEIRRTGEKQVFIQHLESFMETGRT